MSRTFKDKPFKVRFPEVYPYWVEVEKTKKRREVNTEWHWLGSTPSWWNNLFHTRPIRNKFKAFGTKVVGMDLEVIEDMLEPSDSRRPHKYYY